MWSDKYSTKTYDEFLENRTMYDTTNYGRDLMRGLQVCSDINYRIQIIDCQFLVTDSDCNAYELTYNYSLDSFKKLTLLIEHLTAAHNLNI